MTTLEIIKAYLAANGYEGLYTLDCGCGIDDLAPCGEYFGDCKPGYKGPCPGPDECEVGGDCPWHVGPTKSESGGTSDEDANVVDDGTVDTPVHGGQMQ